MWKEKKRMKEKQRDTEGPRCMKLTIDGNFAIYGNFNGNLEFDWLLRNVTMVVTIDDKVTINGNFYGTGPDMKRKQQR